MDIYQFEFPITIEALRKIESVLQNSRLLTYPEDREETTFYSAEFFRGESSRFETRCAGLVDLNVFKDILSIGRPDDARSIEHRRTGAALVLFCQCANIVLEPCIALNESPSQVQEELQLFRKIDNADPEDLLRIAMGEWDRIPLHRLPELPSESIPQFPRHLKNHRSLMTSVIKIAILARSPIKPLNKIKDFLTWCFEDFLFSKEAIALAVVHLNGRCKSPLLKSKKVYSKDRESRISAIENAVWDLLFIRDWSRRALEQASKNELWLLISRDRTLQQLARHILTNETDKPSINLRFNKFLTEHWSESDATSILSHYLSLESKSDHPRRAANRPDFRQHCDCLFQTVSDDLKNL